TPPAAPSNLQATALDDNDIQLTWTNNAPNDDGVRVYGYDDGTNQLLDPSTTSYTAGSLAAGVSYCDVVDARNPAGLSAYSQVACATTTGRGNSPTPIPAP